MSLLRIVMLAGLACSFAFAATLKDSLVDALQSTPPDFKRAKKLCNSLDSSLTTISSQKRAKLLMQIVMAKPDEAGDAMDVLDACISKGLLEAPVDSSLRYASGAALFMAASGLQLRPTAQLLRSGAPLSFTDPTTGSGPFHAAVANRLLVLDIGTTCLKTWSGADAADHAGAVKAALSYRKWLLGLADSVVKHMPLQAVGTVQIAKEALDGMLRSSWAVGEPVRLATSIYFHHIRVIANGLSFLLLRLMQQAATTAPPEEAVMLVDRHGRNPLHIAAAMGNDFAIQLFLAAPPTPFKDANLLTARDLLNQTAQEIACANRFYTLAELLRNAADVSGPACGLQFEAKEAGTRQPQLDKDEEEVEAEKDDSGGWHTDAALSADVLAALSLAKQHAARGALVEHAAEARRVGADGLVEDTGEVPLPPGALRIGTLHAAGMSEEELAATFFKDFYLTGTPVRITGLGGAEYVQRLRTRWTREALEERMGELTFLVTKIPYAKAYGGSVYDPQQADNAASDRSVRLTIADFLLYMRHCPYGIQTEGSGNDANQRITEVCDIIRAAQGGSSRSPYYIFESPAHNRVNGSFLSVLGEELADDVELNPPMLHTRVPTVPERLLPVDDLSGDPLLRDSPAPKPQFFLGPVGSGSPLHTHKDAVNTLVYGHKVWYLLPPSEAVYSTVPISQWVQMAEAAAVNGTAPGPGEPPDFPWHALTVAEQKAGEVLWVPAGWAHAVLNTEPSIGVAVEWTSSLQLY